MTKLQRLLTDSPLRIEIPIRENGDGHCLIVSGRMDAADDEVLAFVAENVPKYDGWEIREKTSDEYSFFWMVTR